ncbi:MBL fold metallo-hydrolase [Psychromarinibacter halotolerans]|uniref:MBL fold metallo-hydrolase n=1 Tax=Psychromarinibacter halotolerans TaxID=1775175 RepID=A0ABV7GVG3_9RHOB|nr:MBL fold metallo-hydrolase [Psychromarinibacter halotolerans]MDF0595040.1 MBL fold metallo-hydrolase [Psychromarinibacter halotolerans]
MDFDPQPGVPEVLAPGLRRVLAPNPSPMTFRGTNSFLVGEGRVALIDPGPDQHAHRDAILAALAPGERITHILLTHAHRDHSGLVPAMRAATGAPILAFGDALAGRSPVMQALSSQGAGGGEGLDLAFRPDATLADGDTVSDGDWTLTALHTPGHAANHLCFGWDDILFSGDVVMGWASTMVSPPDGDLTAFMATAARLAALPFNVFHPAHGAPIPDPAARCRALIDHRLTREAAILKQLSKGPATPAMLTAAIYTDTPPALLPMAERNVFAHLIDLATRNLATADPALAPDARFALPTGK